MIERQIELIPALRILIGGAVKAYEIDPEQNVVRFLMVDGSTLILQGIFQPNSDETSISFILQDVTVSDPRELDHLRGKDENETRRLRGLPPVKDHAVPYHQEPGVYPRDEITNT